MFANVYMYECALEEVKKEVAIHNLVHVIGVSVCVLVLYALSQY